MPNQPVINSFNAGELSPYVYARNDLSKYNLGCLTLENFSVLPYGGVVRRPAIQFVAETKQDDKVRLISFEFSTADSYVLELGDQYVRFFKDGAPVLSGGSPYEIASPWSASDVYGLKFVQSADVMWFCHPDYPVYKLTRISDTSWTLAELDPDYPALKDLNTTSTTLTPSATTGAGITLTASSSFFDANHVGAYFEIQHPRQSNTLITAQDVVGSGVPVQPDVPVGTANTISGRGTVKLETNDAGSSQWLAVWRSEDGGITWQKWRLYNLNGRNVLDEWEEEDSSALYCITTTLTVVFKLQVEEFYVTGLVKVTGFTSATQVTADVVQDLGGTTATDIWTEGAWSEYRGYPKACAIWESRLIFAGTLNEPNTIWLSKSDEFEDFETGDLDTDGMRVTIGSGLVDDIVWLVPQRPLVIGTAGSEWVLEAESDSKPVTPSSFSLKRKTTYGSKDLQATMVNSSVLFMMRQGRKLREFTYKFEVDDYVAPDLTILSEHITEGGIVNAAYQQQPDNILHMIREDGTWVPMTYERDQEVVALSRWTLNDGSGKFDSVAVISRDSNEDQVWASCTLTVDGATKRYIGFFDNREWGTDVATEWNGSDFYKVFNSPASTTLTGLDIFEGLTVDVVRDGLVEPQKVVSSGSITIEKAGDRVVVGVPYKSTLAPIYIEPLQQFQQPMGKHKSVFQGTLRFKDTIGGMIGQSLDSMTRIKFRKTTDAMDNQINMFSGTKKTRFGNEFEYLHTVYIQQDKPLPMTVIALIPSVEVYG